MRKIGMLGVGNMATAIAHAIHKAGFSLSLHNRTMSKIELLVDELNAIAVEKEALLDELISPSELIFIGVKPHQFESVFNDLASSLNEQEPKVWVSMAAGLSLEYLKKLTPMTHHWIRIMPNTPVQVGEGFIAYSYSRNIPNKSLEMFRETLKFAGRVEPISEDLFEAVTGLAGSSPAFIYQLIEAMSDVGVQYGLPRQDSIKMAAQAVKGAAAMILDTDEHPAVLKDKVTSPNGTTIEGVIELDKAGFRASIAKGVTASIEKAKDMNV